MENQIAIQAETKTVKLMVNVINQLKLLRQSTFKDPLCFLDEDIQNAQRAKAASVHIDVDTLAGTVTIANDGQILKNPQALFSIADSEWDDDVKTSENPFGMGFFSNITVSNLLTIHSGSQMITFDVEKMINSGDTEIAVEYTDDYYDGFELTLHNFDFKVVDSWQIKDRVKMLGKYIHELLTYYNGTLQEHKDLTQGDGSPYMTKITEEKDFQGWLALMDNYSWDNNITLFYKGREVCKLSGMPYLKGDLHISDRTLNLTSPDRKGIIQDEKLENFKLLISLYAEQLCSDTLLNHSRDHLEEYSHCMHQYLDKEKIKDKIRFMTFKSNDEKDFEYLRGIAITLRKDNNIRNFDDYQLYLEEQDKVQAESICSEDVEIPATPLHNPMAAEGSHYVGGGYGGGGMVAPEIKESELTETDGEFISDHSDPIFYLEFGEVSTNEYKLNVARHYNLKIIVARNKIESDILKSMHDTDNIFHISELDEKVTISGTLSNTVLSKPEQRALMLFAMISKIVGLDHNVFRIGDLLVTRNIKVDSLGLESNVLDDRVVVLKDSDSEKIYVDRSIINKRNLRDSDSDRLAVSDFRFIMNNLLAIVDELVLLGIKYPKDDEDESKRGRYKVAADFVAEILSALGTGNID